MPPAFLMLSLYIPRNVEALPDLPFTFSISKAVFFLSGAKFIGILFT